MDGDFPFDATDTPLAFTGLSAGGAMTDLFQRQREARTEGFRKAQDNINPIAGLLRLWISAVSAILGTFATWWLGHLFLTPSELLQQAMPEAVAVLVFFLIARLR